MVATKSRVDAPKVIPNSIDHVDLNLRRVDPKKIAIRCPWDCGYLI